MSHIDARDRSTRDCVEAILRDLAPPDVTTGARLIDPADEPHLFEAERKAVERSCAARRQEFASGRALLRELLGERVPLPPRTGQSPSLPYGVVCSLAHDHLLAVAAVSISPAIRAVGIDIEPAGPYDADLADMIVRLDEPLIDARMAFAMKEAAFKVWSDLGGGFLEPHQVRLDLDGRQSFGATVVGSGIRYTGRWARAEGRWLALVIEHTPSDEPRSAPQREYEFLA